MTAGATQVRGRVLLICPKFFSYHEAISRQVRDLGYEVTWWDDRPSHRTFYKLLLRRFPAATGRFSKRFFVDRIAALPRDSFSHVLIVKGEALSRGAVVALRERFPTARFSLYFWDAVENAPNARAAADLFDHVATFDPADAERYKWHYRPLFSENNPTPAAASDLLYDWSFIGTIHSDRLQVIHRLYEDSPDRKRVFVFGYFPSAMLRLIHRATGAEAFAAGMGRMSTVPMPATEARRVTEQSLAVLDVEHPSQRGLTIRTIETLLAGRKLITTNGSIRKSRLYDPSRVCIIDRSRPSVPRAFFEIPFQPVPDAVRHAYSTRCWAEEMLGLSATPQDAHL